MQRFGELLRKLWNPRSFKSHVSPHEMLQVRLLPSCRGGDCVHALHFPSWGVSVSAPPTTSHRLSLLPARRGSRSQNRVRLFLELCNLPAPPPPCPLLQSCPWPRPSTGDPVEFLSWLLNTLHLALGGSKKAHSSESTHDLGGKQCVHFCLSFAALEQYVCTYQ